MAEEFNVFISWSGDRSRIAAEALREWLPMVVQAAKPWMSAVDIEKGARGMDEIGSKLQSMRVGIVCLTPENVGSSWIHYEAGALSKTIGEKTRLCTYLLGGLKSRDIRPPLSMFQATVPEKTETLELVSTINRAVSDSPISDDRLHPLYEATWPLLEKELAKIPKSAVATTKRGVEDIATEILGIARAEAENTEALKLQVSEIRYILQRAPFAPQSRLTALQRILWGEEAFPTALGKLSDLLGDAGPTAPAELKHPFKK